MTAGLRWTPEQYQELMRKRAEVPARAPKRATPAKPAPVAAKPAAVVSDADARVLRADASMKRFQALGRLPKGKMNKTEAEFAEVLKERERIGSVLFWKFHPMRVRLADNTYYEVDFLVQHADSTLWIYETKGGYVTDKGQIKIKLCAEVLPIFGMVKASKLPKKDGGGWRYQEYSA